VFPRRLFAALALGLLLPGCPLTDHYYLERGSDTGAEPGTSGFGATGGTFVGAGGGDGVGGDLPSGDAGTGDADGSGASTSDAGSGFGTGGDTSVGGDTAAGDTGGTPPIAGMGGTLPMEGGGGTTGATGGTLGGDGSTGGDTPGTGGALGGSAGAGIGGTAPKAGNGPTGGMAMGGGGPHGGTAGAGAYQPLCDDAVVKGSACSRTSVQRCYRACGPDGVGFKLETCMGPSYMEGDCQFPASADYSCYDVPAPYRLPAACPAGVPRAADTCDVPMCTPCFSGSMSNPQYQDSTGSQKMGYCVCNAAGVWTCATSTNPSSWPCPGNPGCT
jgi:hypothetical protein